jgi:hypothetical protein
LPSQISGIASAASSAFFKSQVFRRSSIYSS